MMSLMVANFSAETVRSANFSTGVPCDIRTFTSSILECSSAMNSLNLVGKAKVLREVFVVGLDEASAL